MNSEYDLTNEEGLNFAIGGTLKGDGWVSSQPNSLIGNSVAFSIGKGMAKLIYKGIDLFDSKTLCEIQAKTASDLIKEGKKNGVKKMKNNYRVRSRATF